MLPRVWGCSPVSQSTPRIGGRRVEPGNMRFEADMTITAAPEAIWAAVADPEAWPRWAKSIHRVKKLSEGPVGVGSKLRITLIIIIPVRLYMTVTEFVPGQRVAMEGKSLLGRMSRYYMLKPWNGGTRAIAGGEAGGPLAPVTWLFGQVVSKEIVQDLKLDIEG